MTACYTAGDFKAYFIENMTDLGLSVPSNLFDSYQKALESAAFITAALKTLGSGATVSQLVGATFLPEKILGLASLGAAGYVGAVIGSIAVASGRSLGCGSRIADMFVFMHLHPELKFEGGSSSTCGTLRWSTAAINAARYSRIDSGPHQNILSMPPDVREPDKKLNDPSWMHGVYDCAVVGLPKNRREMVVPDRHHGVADRFACTSEAEVREVRLRASARQIARSRARC